MIKLETRTCDYDYSKIASLPCQHAIAAIGYADMQLRSMFQYGLLDMLILIHI